MQTITFECEIITPLFMGGADGITPELRAPSIKGAMRFWWRAMNGDLPLEKLRQEETALFGGVGKNENEGRRSAFNIFVESLPLSTRENILVPHKPFMRGNSFDVKGKFEVSFSMLYENEQLTLEQVGAIFQMTCLFGGFGKRVRRGMGSVCVVSGSEGYFRPIQGVRDIKTLIEKATQKKLFQEERDRLVSNFRSLNQHPYIKQIDIGRPTAPDQITRKISNTAHELHQANQDTYEPSLGHAFKGRFASPVYASVTKIGGKYVPIVTTLNTVPDRNKHKVDGSLQETFVKNIL